MSRIFGLWIALLPMASWAQSEAVETAKQQVSEIGGGLPNPSEYVGQIVMSLILVLLIIFAAAWLLRRFGRFSAVAEGKLQVLGAISVGQRERIMLVQVGEEQLLIGVTTSRISTLHRLNAPLQFDDQDLESKASAPDSQQEQAESELRPKFTPSSFTQRLQEAIKQRLSQ